MRRDGVGSDTPPLYLSVSSRGNGKDGGDGRRRTAVDESKMEIAVRVARHPTDHQVESVYVTRITSCRGYLEEGVFVVLRFTLFFPLPFFQCRHM